MFFTIIFTLAPTCILIQPNGNTLEAFGTDAEIRYTELSQKEEHTDWYFFRRFKMQLYDTKRSIGQSTMLTDETGKELHALTVYSLSIKYMKDNFYDSLNSITSENLRTSDICWVLTVPDIWNEPAKQFMIMSAREAGIEIEHLSIASEPEAATTYCLFTESNHHDPRTSHISTFRTGERYLVCDIGGDTVYITVHKVTLDMKLKQIEAVNGGEWLVTKAHEEFEKYIDTLAGCHVMQASKNKHMDEYIELMNTFDLKRKTFTKSTDAEKIRFIVPCAIRTLVEQMTGQKLQQQVQRSIYGKTTYVTGDKLVCSESDLSALFDEPITSIIRQLNPIVSKYVDDPINHIIMTGGFSESLLLQDALREAFPTIKVTVPIDANEAVLGGAVILGHNDFQIISRVA
ncbi:heat shock 70 kDa protein 12A-like [Dreissena polymorpha]|uniref:heat shock 70 kDa protein 12A-like n=1 Tax=Dreissena polymorpha TaxID=45954 RepID=UPI0022647BE0|nr:heat shock 70 kDa protein 12A-like [Dreissena polymorpha]